MSQMAAPSRETLALSQLLPQIDGVKEVWGPDRNITGVNADSRRLQAGEVFVAINGSSCSGQQFIPQAIRGNCSCLVVENVPNKKWLHRNVTIIQVENSRRVLAQLAAAFYRQPARNLTCIGVTGTCGKTTTSFLINHILEKLQYKTGLLGTLWQKINKDIFPSDITTPEPPRLQRLLADMCKQKVSHTVMEVSSHSLCQERVAGIPFTTAVFTNLGREHLDYHKTPANYLAAKTKLFTSLTPKAYAVLNIDDPAGEIIKKQTSASVLTYGVSSKADLTASRIHLNSQGFSYLISLNRSLSPLGKKRILPQQWPLSLKLLGQHNIYNILGAIGAGLTLGLEPEIIGYALKNFPGVPRRLEIIYQGPFTILDDYGHNETSLNAVFSTIATLKYRNLVIVNWLKGSRGVRTNEITAEQLTTAAKRMRVKRIITTRSDSHVIPKYIVQPEEEAAFTTILQNKGIPVTNTKELPAAIRLGLASVEAGDILLLLGPYGMDAGAELARRYLQEGLTPCDLASSPFPTHSNTIFSTLPTGQPNIDEATFLNKSGFPLV